MPRVDSRLLTSLVTLLLLAAPLAAQSTSPALAGLDYDLPWVPGAVYDPAVATPSELLGFEVGRRPASPEQVAAAMHAWDEASERTRLVQYATSHEGRGLYYMVVTSPENLARLDEIQAGIDALADPRGLSRAESDQLVETLPTVAWLAHSIHGNESSGTDSALVLTYHLAAAQGDEVEALLSDLVVLIDPMMNPDGRARFVKTLAEHRQTSPNVDNQSLLHQGYWPGGRTNHYLFDLNRDWILGVNPETRGRIREAGRWHPLLFVDAHEMGSQDTYLFSPQRSPTSPHYPERRGHWSAVFARGQAAAFDRYNWPYYTGEWNEGWYPGYSDAWAIYRGAVGILYEQASVDEDGVRRLDGSILTYREAVHHQLTSNLANLATLREHGRQLLSEFAAERRLAVDANGPYAGRTFAIPPTAHQTRLTEFLDLMALQGIEVYRVDEEVQAAAGVDQLGRRFGRRTLPAGTLLVPNRQPEAPLVATMLEFDTRMTPEYSARERESLVREGQSTVYDLTAWNLTMMFGLEALTLDSGLPAGAQRVEESAAAAGGLEATEDAIAYVIDGVDDASVAAAARLMELEVEVRVATRAFDMGNGSFARGSVVATRRDNPELGDDLGTTVGEVAASFGLTARGVSTGLGEGELPDLGGGYFERLEPPRIAVVGRGGINPYDFGSIWYTLDHRYPVRHSHLDDDGLDFSDLRRYNVIVYPHRWWGELSEGKMKALGDWVEDGGTLVAIGTNAGAIANEDGLARVRSLPAVLGELDDYELAIQREWLVRDKAYPEGDELWTHVATGEAEYPWEGSEESRPATEELERRDAWQSTFMPQGAFLAARVDEESWLTFGASEWLPVLTTGSQLLMAKPPAEAPVRYGVLNAQPEREAGRVGWASVPAGEELRLRMSGLLWPEAAERLANTAYVTRERKGNGQIILFSTFATYRASTRPTTRLLANAILYGPGLGARHPIQP